MAPAVYRTRIRHVRTEPLRNSFTYASYQWFVDLQNLPRLPLLLRPFARFETRDHCCDAADDPAGSLYEIVARYLDAQGVDLRGGPIRMLTNARVLGYVFNPLTVYWCFARTETGDERLACVVAEVHNTYGGRHRYLLRPDERSRANTDKEFYVSPFYPVGGHYTMTLPQPANTLALGITLHPPHGAPFVASVRGRRYPAQGAALVRLLLGRPWTTLAVSARIRWQAIKLYLRGLPVIPRHTAPEKGSP